MNPTSILPVSGWKPLAGSSVVTLHWMAQPFTRILSCLRFSSGRLRPSHTCSWACTRSTLLESERVWVSEWGDEVNKLIEAMNIVWIALNFPWCRCGEHVFCLHQGLKRPVRSLIQYKHLGLKSEWAGHLQWKWGFFQHFSFDQINLEWMTRKQSLEVYLKKKKRNLCHNKSQRSRYGKYNLTNENKQKKKHHLKTTACVVYTD